MASGVNEEQGTVNTCVLDVTVTHGSELFAKVGAVLILDVFHDGIPATDQ
jgi:hypothetical protein